MCLAIPGRLEKIVAELDETFRAGIISFDGIVREVNLSLVPEAKVGDYVLVHVGTAISVIDRHEAERTIEVLKMMGEPLNPEQTDG